MIIHNTTYSVVPPVEAKWVLWVKEHHMPAINKLPGVSSCRFLKLLTEVEQDGIIYTIQVELADLDAGETFLEVQDPVFQAEMQAHFPGQVLYFQTLLKVM